METAFCYPDLVRAALFVQLNEERYGCRLPGPRRGLPKARPLTEGWQAPKGLPKPAPLFDYAEHYVQ
jgi:hypothetical protein